MRRIVALCVLVACGAPGPTTPLAPAHVPTAIERAEALERGDGVARDYAAAAKIYRSSCAQGAGDLTACRRLLRAAFDGRGTDAEYERTFELAAAMCARDDLTGCVVTAMAQRDQTPQQVVDKVERLTAEPCDAAHLARCEAGLEPFGSWSQSGSREYARHEFDGRGCALGVLESCIDLRFASGTEHDAAVAVMTKACNHGDADACEAIERPLQAAPLCAAHDYRACMAVGCAGDAAAAEIARAHGVEPRCGGHQPYAIAPVATGIVAKQQQVFDNLVFREIGTGQPVWFEAYNAGTREIETAIGEVYAYDAAGQQLGRHHFELQQARIPPGAGTLISLGGLEGAAFDPCVSFVSFSDDRQQHVARCPHTKAKGARWGNGGDNVLLHVSLPDIPLAEDWVDKLVPTLLEPFEQSHLGIVVYPDFSGAGQLALSGAATDLALLTKELGGSVAEVPLVWSPVSIAFQVTGVDELQLSARTLARIFTGEITRWNDPAIASDNRGKTMPDLAIVAVQETQRDDQLIVTRYFTRLARGAWKLGEMTTGSVGKPLAFEQPYGIAKKLADTPGSIGYVGPGIAEAAKLSVAKIQNARGAFVAPTPAAVASGAYPLVAPRSLYIATKQRDQATADAVRAFASWLLGDGLAIFERIGYVRQPAPNAAAKLRAIAP